MPYDPQPGSGPGYGPSQAGGAGYSPSQAPGAAPAGGGTATAAPNVEQICGTPGEIAVYLPPPHNKVEYMSVLGVLAERRIQVDFCEQHQCQPFLRPGSLQYDYFDDSRDPKVLIAYYKYFNSHVTDAMAGEMLAYARRRKMLKFADIVRHLGDIHQHFEIKPASKSGIADGREKLALLDAFIDYFKLPYRRGTFYTPAAEMPLATVRVEGIPLELFLSVERSEPGMLAYRFCVRGEIAEAMKRLRKLMGKLALIIILIGIIIPIEDPIEQPVEDPAVDPVPWPIPAGADIILPVPWRGNVDGEFSFEFRYVRGLSRSHKKGGTYPVTLSFESEGNEYFVLIDFLLKDVRDNASYLLSANKGMVNIAPARHKPLILSPKTEMVVHWHE